MKKTEKKKDHPLINIGASTVLYKKDVLGVFNLDTASTGVDTKRYLSDLERKKRLETVGTDIPKSFVVFLSGRKEKAYITTLSSASVYGRWKRQSKYL